MSLCALSATAITDLLYQQITLNLLESDHLDQGCPIHCDLPGTHIGSGHPCLRRYNCCKFQCYLRELPSIKNFLSYHSYLCVSPGMNHFFFSISMKYFSYPSQKWSFFFFFLNNMISSCSQASPMTHCLLPLWRPPLSLVVQTAVDILPLEWFPLLLNELLSWHYSAEVTRLFPSAALCLFCFWLGTQDWKDLFVFFFMSRRTSRQWLRIRMISFPCENIPSVFLTTSEW